jgi:phosphatidylglycerol:prolipoprotein diacylglycerol transferase
VLRQAPQKGIDTNIIHNLFIWVFLGGAAGGMLLGQGGLSLLGGVFGVLIAGFLYLKLSKNLHLFLPIADITVLVTPVSIAMSRIGCALINDHQGAVTSLPWAIIWPDGVMRHPVAEYLIINALIIFSILRFLKSRLKKPGQLFFSFLFLYSFSRFFLDFTRSTGTFLSDPHYFGLSTTQWLSLLIIFVILIVRNKFLKKVEDNLI